MSRTLSRALAGASILALVVAAPASAFAATHGHAPAEKPKHHATKPHPAKFTLVGVFVSSSSDTSTVGAPTITITVKTGRDHKHLRDTNVVVAVPSSAKIVRNGARADLTALQPGDHVVAIGRMVGDVRTASHVNAAGRPPISPTPPDTTTVTTSD